MTTAKPRQKRVILVLGMHRSGTSALTRIINLLGVDLGGNFLRPADDNPRGYWEHAEAVAINEQLLHALGRTWSDTRALPGDWLTSVAATEARSRINALIMRDFAGSLLWAVKDPRLCRLAPVWIEVATALGYEVCVVMAVRHPGEVSSSLLARDGLPVASTELSWVQHLAEAEYVTRNYRRSLVVYRDVLANWREMAFRVSVDLGFAWPKDFEVAGSSIDGFLDRKDKHHTVDHADDPLASNFSRDLYTQCVTCAHGGESAWKGVSDLVDAYRKVAPTLLGDIAGRADEMDALAVQFRDSEEKVLERDITIASGIDTNRENERKIFGLLETVHGKDLHIQSREEVIRRKDLEIQRRDEMVHARDRELATRDEAVHAKDTEINIRDEMIQRMEARVVECRLDLLEHLNTAEALLRDEKRERDALQQVVTGNNEQLIALKRESTSLGESVAHLQSKLAQMESSLSWQLTRPLRATKRAVRGIYRGAFRPMHGLGQALKTGEARAKYASLAKSLGPVGAVKHAYGFMRRGGPKPIADIDGGNVFDLRKTADLPVVVLCTRHCHYVGESIVRALGRAGIASRMIFERPERGYDDVPHFVICPQMFPNLPGLYVSFQMEQSVSSRWFTTDYLRRLENSFAVFDYSLDNIEKLVSLGLYAKQFYYLPIAYLPDYLADQGATKYEYDVLFYGDINNDRRRTCLAELEKVCRVKVVNDTFGTALFSEIAKAKLVVNIHYYPGALLETTRIWECLSLGNLVVSERSSDMQYHDELLPVVDFVDVDDFASMISRVQYWLADDARRERRVKDNSQALHSMFNRFDYFFYRFLLATDNISFEDFWTLVGSQYPLSSDKLALNLPEYIDRAASFDKDNVHGFQRFPGLRHSKGWVGCALSYKYMIRLAREHNLPAVTICEDDVAFPPDFAATWPEFYDYLLKNPGDWDIFSGLMADLNADAKVLDVRSQGEYELVTTDKLISTVFNVYNQACYNVVTSWDETNRDVTTNTIDRYLEKSRAIKVMTTSPFLVGHKEELHSTLWGGQNTIYTELIAKSEALLREKINVYKQRSGRWLGRRRSSAKL